MINFLIMLTFLLWGPGVPVEKDENKKIEYFIWDFLNKIFAYTSEDALPKQALVKLWGCGKDSKSDFPLW